MEGGERVGGVRGMMSVFVVVSVSSLTSIGLWRKAWRGGEVDDDGLDCWKGWTLLVLEGLGIKRRRARVVLRIYTGSRRCKVVIAKAQ